MQPFCMHTSKFKLDLMRCETRLMTQLLCFIFLCDAIWGVATFEKTGFFSLTAHWTERTVAFHCCISPHKTTDWSPGVTSVPVSKSLCRFSPPLLLAKKRRASSVPKKETTQTEHQHSTCCALWRKNHVDVVVVVYIRYSKQYRYVMGYISFAACASPLFPR